MTDYSQLPSLNPIAPQHEEPWLRLPTWLVMLRVTPIWCVLLWGWANFCVILLCLWEAYIRHFHSGARCGNLMPVTEFSLCLTAANLCLWFFFAMFVPKYCRSAKVVALLSIIMWSGVVGGIYVGRMLPIDSDSPTSFNTPQNKRL